MVTLRHRSSDNEEQKSKRTRSGMSFTIVFRFYYVNRSCFFSLNQVRGHIDDRGICKGVAYSRAITDLYSEGYILREMQIRDGCLTEVYKISEKGETFGNTLFDVPILPEE